MSSLFAPITNTNRASPAMDNNWLREGRDGRSATYRVLGMSPFAPFVHTRVVLIHQGLSRNAPSGAQEWAWPARRVDALILLLEQEDPDLHVEWNALTPRP